MTVVALLLARTLRAALRPRVVWRVTSWPIRFVASGEWVPRGPWLFMWSALAFTSNVQRFKSLASLTLRVVRGGGDACGLCDEMVGLVLRFDDASPDDIDCRSLCPFGLKRPGRAEAGRRRRGRENTSTARRVAAANRRAGVASTRAPRCSRPSRRHPTTRYRRRAETRRDEAKPRVETATHVSQVRRGGPLRAAGGGGRGRRPLRVGPPRAFLRAAGLLRASRRAAAIRRGRVSVARQLRAAAGPPELAQVPRTTRRSRGRARRRAREAAALRRRGRVAVLLRPAPVR